MKKFNLFFLIYASLFFGILTTQAQSLSVAATVISNVSCYGGSNGSIFAYTSGGTTPYTYLWSPGSQTSQTATGLSASTYTVQVTDLLGTTASTSATISQPISLGLSASAKFSSVCPGNSDSLFASGTGGVAPYAYTWTAPFGDISCNTCQNTNAYPYGVAYVVTAINDMNGCSATAAVSIIVRPFPYVTISGPINPIAPSRSDTLVASVVGSASYLWSNSATTSSIIVSPSVSTTYYVTTTNMYGCYDTDSYTVDTNTVGKGSSSSSPIRIVPSTNVTNGSYSTLDSLVWFTFIPTDSNNQIIANSAFLGMPVPHVHRLTLYNSSLVMIEDEFMPDITGANQIRIDISHLHPGSSYYVRAARCPAHANMAGCNPSASGECNASQRWDFKICFRTVPVFVPDDSGSEAPSISQLYYECRGQKEDLNGIPRFDIKAYTDNASPAVYLSDSAVSFVYQHVDTSATFIDTVQRVDMVLTGTGVEPSQPVFKAEEDSGAGYLNYYLGYVPNGVPKVEGYSRLVYKNVYSNLDMQVYSNNAGTKLYFICNPTVGTTSGGNPADIELQFKGATSVNTTGGALNVVTELGTLSFAPGFAYTDSAGIIKPKSWQPYFISVNSNTVRFNTGAYNTGEPLIIRVDRGHKPLPGNPTNNLEWSTYCGGGSNDVFLAVRNDGWGSNEVTTGYTSSTNFPVTNGAVKGALKAAKVNAVIASFNANNIRNWSTYFGGSVAPDADYGRAVTTDASSNVYITGNTNSADFPILIPNGAFTNPGGYNGDPDDAFIVELNVNGGLVWSTYFGGSAGSQVGDGIVEDANNNLFVVGGQYGTPPSSAIPTYTVAGAFNSTSGNGWIAKFNSSHAIVWATDIGGNNGVNGTDDKLYACDVDLANNLYVTGDVEESGFPVGGPSPILPFVTSIYGIHGNAVVAKIDGSSLAIDWATYYGGDGYDRGTAIVANGTQDGNVYITGETSSPDPNTSIPISNGMYGYPAYQTNLGGTGQTNAFIAGFTQSSGLMEFGTYFGGNATIYGLGITWNNGIYITGPASFNSLPLPQWGNPPNTWNVTSVPGAQAGFIAFFPYSLTNNLDRFSYNWGTYFGGNGTDNPFGIMSTNNDVYMVGSTSSTNFPFDNAGTPTPWYQVANAGYSDAFISEFAISPTLVGAGINSIASNNKMEVYPNPTPQDVTVQLELEKAQDMEFIIYNLLGQPVYSNMINEPAGLINQEIDLSLLPNGIYLLKVNEDNKYLTQKIIKQN